MVKVSIAMAVYNGENFIRKQIESIIAQMEPQDELIISYDKSDDNTLKIIRDYESRYTQISVIENKDAGVITNFNNAILSCTGDYIFVADQDDVWDRNKRDVLCKKFEVTHTDLIIHNGVNINVNDEIISGNFFDMYRINRSTISYYLKPRYSGCCMAFSRRLQEYILPIPKNIGAYDHWIGIIGKMNGKVEFVEDVLVYHRIHDNNVTPRHSQHIIKIMINRLGIFVEAIKRKRVINA